MKKNIKKIVSAVLIVPALAFGAIALAPLSNVSADCTPGDGLNGALSSDCTQGNGQVNNLTGQGGVVTTVINVLLFVVGLLAVVMLIYGGIRYITSGGDQNRVTSAKNTILYAVVGLIIAIVAYALVNWVFTSINKTS